MLPEREGNIAVFTELENSSMSCQGPAVLAVPAAVPNIPAPQCGAPRGLGGLPEQGEDMGEEEGEEGAAWGAGGESEGELCGPGMRAAGKVAKTVPSSALPPNMPSACG